MHGSITSAERSQRRCGALRRAARASAAGLASAPHSGQTGRVVPRRAWSQRGHVALVSAMCGADGTEGADERGEAIWRGRCGRCGWTRGGCFVAEDADGADFRGETGDWKDDCRLVRVEGRNCAAWRRSARRSQSESRARICQPIVELSSVSLPLSLSLSLSLSLHRRATRCHPRLPRQMASPQPSASSAPSAPCGLPASIRAIRDFRDKRPRRPGVILRAWSSNRRSPSCESRASAPSLVWPLPCR